MVLVLRNMLPTRVRVVPSGLIARMRGMKPTERELATSTMGRLETGERGASLSGWCDSP